MPQVSNDIEHIAHLELWFLGASILGVLVAALVMVGELLLGVLEPYEGMARAVKVVVLLVYCSSKNR